MRKSFTAKDTEDAKEEISLTAKVTKDAKKTIISPKPEGREGNAKRGSNQRSRLHYSGQSDGAVTQ